MHKIVGIGEYILSDNKKAILKTFALGSCVAITLYSPKNSIAGMAHIVLPSPESSKRPINSKPCYYASKALPFLINQMSTNYGCAKEELEIELFGGANSGKLADIFQIGARNLDMLGDIMREAGLVYKAEEVGGNYSRTVEIDVATGISIVRSQPMII